MKTKYGSFLFAGRPRLEPERSWRPDPLEPLLAEFRERREAGEPVSIRRFCGENGVSQKQFERRLRAEELPESAAPHVDPAFLAYYARPDVQQALYAWARDRRLAPHFSQGVISRGFRQPEEVLHLAAAGTTRVPTFHASVGRYEGDRLVAFDLVAEVDHKGNWRECFRATRPLVEALQSAGVTFLVKFSGHSSVHVIVPCQGQDYHPAVEAFLRRLPQSRLRARQLDRSFRRGTHLLRMPYALHERTGLVSLPLALAEYDSFDPEMARPETVAVDPRCLEPVLRADNLPWLLE
jgi:hypothetical protein